MHPSAPGTVPVHSQHWTQVDWVEVSPGVDQEEGELRKKEASSTPCKQQEPLLPGVGEIACSVADGAPSGGWEGKEPSIPVWMEDSVGSHWIRRALI